MTCKDIMTPNPSCCLPGDSVAIAAQIMRQNDIGPVLVVSDQEQKRLIGIVTDRDLALKVIADGRDAHGTRVDQVMSLNPICCREDEDTHRALQLMANHQIRRIPIVDEDNRLSGIVAQADIALHEDEEEVGRVVEHISEPYGSAGWSEKGNAGQSGWMASPFAAGAVCLGIGAGLMYAMRGSRSPQAEQPIGHPDDNRLTSNLRSRIRKVSNARDVEVACQNGTVTLTGPILESSVRQLLDCVSATPGVNSVRSRLEVFDAPGGHPSLRRRGSALSSLLAGITSGGLLFLGSKSRTRDQERDRELATRL